jgi:hypothetical protein
MSIAKRQRPNAYKHGAFNRTTIVPGENRQEFEALHSDLVQEWTPVGATEQDAVLSIAKAIWRKRRAQRFLELQLLNSQYNIAHPSYDENRCFEAFISRLLKEPLAFERHASQFLKPDMISQLQQMFPGSNFRTEIERAAKVIDYIKTDLLPEMVRPQDRVAEQYGLLVLSAAYFTEDVSRQELMLDERLDAMIDRAVKRLIQTKAMKQMLAQTETELSADQSRKVGKKGRDRK